MRDGKQSKAKFSCRNCEEALCPKCRRDHTKFRQFVDHKIVELKKTLTQLVHDRSEDGYSRNPSYRKSKDVRGKRVAQDVTSVDVKTNNKTAECTVRCKPSVKEECSDVTSEDKSTVNRKDGSFIDDDVIYLHPVSRIVDVPGTCSLRLVLHLFILATDIFSYGRYPQKSHFRLRGIVQRYR